MRANFQPSLTRIRVYEGGKVNNPRDPGGKTNYGITQRTYNAWRRAQNLGNADVYAISLTEVAEIYKKEYWDRIDGDLLPSGLDLAVFDGAVNSGVGTSILWLQGALGISMDGSIGAKTLAAIPDDYEHIIDDMLQRRLGSLERLKTYPEFGRGWHARISNVKKISDAWAEAGIGANTGPSPVSLTDIGGHTKANMDDVKTSPVTMVQAHVATGASAVGTGATQAAETLTPVADTLNWLKYALGGLTCIAAVAGVALMISKQANDDASGGVRKKPVNPGADDGIPTVTVTDDPTEATSGLVQPTPAPVPPATVTPPAGS